MWYKIVGVIAVAGLLLGMGCSGLPSASREGQEPRAPAPSAPQGGSSGESAAGSVSAVPPPASASDTWDRYVIRSGDMSLVVKDVDAAAEDVKKVAIDAGGYVSQSAIQRDGNRVRGTVTIQVPADRFDSAMSALRALAVTVESADVTTQDVTEEYIDNESRLKNLRATEQATQKLLDQADTMDSILAIQRELTSIRGEIEKIEGRQNYLQRRTSMSTIKVKLSTEPATEISSSRAGWQPGSTAVAAWETSLSFLAATATVLLTLVVFLWWVIPLALIVWWLIRRRRRARATKTTSPPTAHPTEPPSPPTEPEKGGAAKKPKEKK